MAETLYMLSTPDQCYMTHPHTYLRHNKDSTGKSTFIEKYMTSWASDNTSLRQTMAEDKPSGGFTHLSGPAGPGTASDENKDHC
jgi:hypothetical protein